MYLHIQNHLAAIEANAAIRTRQDALKAIAELGLDDFGLVLWSMPNPLYPRLSALLPAMTPDEVTIEWTGAAGNTLLLQSVAFVRSCAEHYCSLTGRTLSNRRILDFGCGYGRLLRLFSCYSADVFGVDAWDISLSHCRNAGLGDQVALSEVIPKTLPYKGKFDFAFAFSVFTSLSEQSATACLAALRRAAAPGAVLCVTLRPWEYWDFAKTTSLKAQSEQVDQCALDHARTGFAYLPHVLPGGGFSHYGDASMELNWLEARAPGWRISAVDRSLTDSFQRYVFLVAV